MAASKFDALASQIVNNLKAPDIIALQEVGPNNNAVTDGSATFNSLIAAITVAGGPTYDFRQINPVDGQDGGPGNNRVGFIFRTDRGVQFVDRPGGASTNANSAVPAGGGMAQLQFSPAADRPRQCGVQCEPKIPGRGVHLSRAHLFVIANHFTTKGGDQPFFGRFQPPAFPSETQRLAQAQVVNDFVDSIVAIDASANVVVLGDLNDFEHSASVNALEGGVLTTLTETLAEPERYTFIFEGNSQALDHVLVSNHLVASSTYDIVHVNAEFAGATTDHDPAVARLTTNVAPVANAQSVSTAEEQPLSITLTSTDTDTDTLSYTVATQPANGILSGTAPNVTYTPATNFAGSDTFTFKTNDGTVDSNVATISITVTEVNDPPVASDDTLADVAEDSGQRTIPFSTLLGNDSAGPGDAGQALTISAVSNVQGGTAQISGSDVLFTPTADYFGPAGFDYTVQDNGTTNGTADARTDVGRGDL